jgi:hypothetical protein
MIIINLFLASETQSALYCTVLICLKVNSLLKLPQGLFPAPAPARPEDHRRGPLRVSCLVVCEVSGEMRRRRGRSQGLKRRLRVPPAPERTSQRTSSIRPSSARVAERNNRTTAENDQKV